MSNLLLRIPTSSDNPRWRRTAAPRAPKGMGGPYALTRRAVKTVLDAPSAPSVKHERPRVASTPVAWQSADREVVFYLGICLDVRAIASMTDMPGLTSTASPSTRDCM